MVEKSKNWAIVVGLLLIGVIVSAGCIGERQPEEGDVSSSPEEAVTPTTQTPTAPPGGELLSDLLGMAKGIDSAKYDVVMTSSGELTFTEKVWEKGNKMRREQTREEEGFLTMIAIIDKDEQEKYTYCPEKLGYPAMKFSEPVELAIEKVVSIEDYNPTIVGTETVDGKFCTVVEYISSEGSPKLWIIRERGVLKHVSPEGSARMWIWQKHGFPIRAEITTPEGALRTDWKNIEFVDIDNSMFELPDGLEIITPIRPGGMQ